MTYPKSETEWGLKATALLKSKLKERNFTYDELVVRLKKFGFKDETRASVTMKFKRSAFSSAFLLACLAVLEAEGLSLDDFKR